VPGFCKRVSATLRGLRRYAAALPALTLILGLGIGAASAQQVSPDERARLQAQKEELFQRMLRNPADLDATFAYADVSARLGDNEAAVSALERMLLFNPDLPRVQLELGALYFRMGSFEIARTYFEKAAAANPPAEVRARIDRYLAEINRQSAPQLFTGFLFFGAQYQSDANIGPGSPLIHSPIGDVLLNSQFVKQADGNAFLTGSALYSYDLGTQSRDTIEVTGTGFLNHYFHIGRLDLALGEITAGPRFNFTEPVTGVTSASLKPYLILNEVGLGGNQYFNTYGVGIEAPAAAMLDFRVKPVFEFRQKNFSNASDRPLSRGLQGSDKLASLLIDKPITENSNLTLEFDYLRQDTRLKYYANDSYAFSGAYRIRYDDPIGFFKLPWETTAFLSRSYGEYDAADPCCVTGTGLVATPAGLVPVNTFSQRHDKRWRFGFTQSFQILDNFAIVVQAQRDVVSSNLSLYHYTSNTVLAGPQIRF
jgi:tetratricopeptide (TPR) repeat protein